MGIIVQRYISKNYRNNVKRWVLLMPAGLDWAPAWRKQDSWSTSLVTLCIGRESVLSTPDPCPVISTGCCVYCPAPAVMIKCRDAWQVPPHSSRLTIRMLHPPFSWSPVPCFAPGWRKFAGLLCDSGFDKDLFSFWELCIMNKIITLRLTWWDSLLLLIELDAEGKWGRASWGKSFRKPNSWQLLKWLRNRKQ